MKRLIAMFALAVCTMATSVVSADTYDHFGQIARKIERQSYDFLKETRHFRQTPQYVHLVQDAAKLARAARHAHLTARIGCNLAHLESDVRDLRAALRHIDDLLHSIEVSAAYGAGRIYGNTAHVHRLVDAMSCNVNDLLADLRQLRRPQIPVHAHPGRGRGVGNVNWSNRPALPPQPHRPTVITSPRVRNMPVGWGNHSVHDHWDRYPTRRTPAGWGNHSVRIGIGF